jgi:hypothetical protein
VDLIRGGKCESPSRLAGGCAAFGRRLVEDSADAGLEPTEQRAFVADLPQFLGEKRVDGLGVDEVAPALEAAVESATFPLKAAQPGVGALGAAEAALSARELSGSQAR